MSQLRNKIMLGITELKDFVTKRSDPALVLFLLLITNYRFSFKAVAIVAIYLYRPNFRIQRNGIFWFYLGVIALSLVNLLFVSGDLSRAHIAVVSAACLIWTVCLLTFHQLTLFVTLNPVEKTVNSLKVLTIINLAFSLFDLLSVMQATHTVNPYSQIAPPPYGISSGDLIGGIFGEMHLVNMSISAFLLFFFLYRKESTYLFCAALPLLLTGSNLGTLITVMALLAIVVLKKSLVVKYQALFAIALVVVFYIKVTPDNLGYFQNTFSKILHPGTEPVTVAEVNKKKTEIKKTADEIKRGKIWQYMSYQHRDDPKPTVDTVYFLKMAKLRQETIARQKREDYTHFKKDSLQFAKSKDRKFDYGHLRKFDFKRRSGKMISFDQLRTYLGENPRHLFFGSGPAGFSSRMAFIVSGTVDDSRILMALPHYENQAFETNHEAIFLYLQFLDDEFHSITNLPFSWYNELLGEYGLLGALLFVVWYLGFFLKKFKRLSYGKYLLGIILAFFLFDYWFQRLSVMVVFELILLLDVKITSEKAEINDAEQE